MSNCHILFQILYRCLIAVVNAILDIMYKLYPCYSIIVIEIKIGCSIIIVI